MKIQPQKDIIELYESYEKFMHSKKSVISPFKINKIKENHRNSLYSHDNLFCEFSFGNVSLNGEIRNRDRQDYSFQILSDAIKSRVVFRYDAGGGVHKNNIPSIPLSQQSIDTPHFHRFNNEGYFFAYKTDKLMDKKEARALCDIEFGFPFFCQQVNIKDKYSEEVPDLTININGEIVFYFDNYDPNEGVIF